VADLFTRYELSSYIQRDVDDATADLLLQLITIEISDYVGDAAYEALGSGQQKFKGIALEAVKRAYLNPDGVRQQSHAIDDYQESQTFATETFGGVELTSSEQARIDRIIGRAASAFTIRAIAEPFRSPPRHPYHCPSSQTF
jgi:hypothetical protein